MKTVKGIQRLGIEGSDGGDVRDRGKDEEGNGRMRKCFWRQWWEEETWHRKRVEEGLKKRSLSLETVTWENG